MLQCSFCVIRFVSANFHCKALCDELTRTNSDKFQEHVINRIKTKKKFQKEAL